MTAGADRHAPLPTPAPGVALFPAGFEDVVAELRTAIAALMAPEPFVELSAPPVIARATVERAGYVAGFPHLLGTVHTFTGDDGEWRELRRHARPGGDWHARQELSDVVLIPAACYHVFAHLAGTTLDREARFGLECYCYRHEATSERGRLRSYRVRELVYVGAQADCVVWRDRWVRQAADWLADLGLDVGVEVASDPFFGHDTRLMRRTQVTGNLKLELTAPVGDGLRQAVASANCHNDHFGAAFDIRLADSAPTHSACTGFGLERLALAVLHARSA